MNKETTHSVPASWYQRLLGFFIDYAICLIIAIPISEDVFDSYFAVYEESNGFTYVSNRYMESEVAKGISCLIYIVYTLTFESIFNKTIGKVITCTVVRDRKSLEKVGFGEFWKNLMQVNSIGRTFFCS